MQSNTFSWDLLGRHKLSLLQHPVIQKSLKKKIFLKFILKTFNISQHSMNEGQAKTFLRLKKNFQINKKK